MNKVIILQGLPGSGKSTWAKEQVAKGGYTRINKDDLREMLHNSKWSKANEKLVLSIRDSIMIKGLRKGDDIIIDDTNLAQKHISRIQEIAEEQGKLDGKTYTVDLKRFDTPLHECIENDLKRARSVGERVIRQMHEQYMRPGLRVEQNEDFPAAIISDLDGTLAIIGNRNPYNPEKHEIAYDKIDSEVEALLKTKQKFGYKIIICSGRSSKYLKETDDWLKKNGITPDLFLMRKEGDIRKDSIVKKEMFMKHILPKYNVNLVLDDRAQIVDTWRDMGLNVWQVRDGNF